MICITFIDFFMNTQQLNNLSTSQITPLCLESKNKIPLKVVEGTNFPINTDSNRKCLIRKTT